MIFVIHHCQYKNVNRKKENGELLSKKNEVSFKKLHLAMVAYTDYNFDTR